jgi:hypothetical protein
MFFFEKKNQKTFPLIAKPVDHACVEQPLVLTGAPDSPWPGLTRPSTRRFRLQRLKLTRNASPASAIKPSCRSFKSSCPAQALQMRPKQKFFGSFFQKRTASFPLAFP